MHPAFENQKNTTTADISIAAPETLPPDDRFGSKLTRSLLRDYVPLHNNPNQDTSTQRIVTLFFMGTQENLSKAEQDDEYPRGCLVARLAKEARSCQQEILAYHGPGVEPDSEHLFKPRSEWHPDVDIATGWSMEDNINDALIALKDRYLRPRHKHTAALKLHRYKLHKIVNRALKPVSQVNIVGWSRGGVSAIKFANACLSDSYISSARINIFAVDPVPGPGNFSKNITTLGSNVDCFEAYYAAHEQSACFHPVIPTRAENNHSTQITYYTMPGYHASLVGNVMTRNKTHNYSGEVDHAAKIIRDAAQKFLLAHGTLLPIENLERLSPEQIAHCYSGVKKNLSSYHGVAEGYYLAYLKHVDALLGLQRENPKLPKAILTSKATPYTPRLSPSKSPSVF
jgi:hypothetical protein